MRRDIRVKPGKAQSIMGLIAGIAFVFVGLFVVIPDGGWFGYLWTFMALSITVMNGINVFSSKGIATSRIEVDELSDGYHQQTSTTEQRLKEAENLYQKGLINKEEYEQKRKDILNNL